MKTPNHVFLLHCLVKRLIHFLCFCFDIEMKKGTLHYTSTNGETNALSYACMNGFGARFFSSLGFRIFFA